MRKVIRLSLAILFLNLLVGERVQASTPEAELEKICSIVHCDANTRAQLWQALFASNKNGGKARDLVNKAPASVTSARLNTRTARNNTTDPQLLDNGGATPQLGGLHFLLRNSWADLGILGPCFGGGVSTPDAKGASLSFTQDNAANNRTWAAQGVAAAVYSICNGSLRPTVDTGLVEQSVAVYAQVNANYNSDAKLAAKNNSDTRTAGLSGELAYLTQGRNYNIVRLTPNVVQDEIQHNTAVAVMGQYIPAFVSYPGIWNLAFLFSTISYQFDPAVDVQYANTTSNKPLLFSNKKESLRIGPEVTLLVTPFAVGANPLLRRIGVNITFHPWYETYSNRGSYWWANSIFYNLDDTGNVSVGFSYNRGLDENSGTMTNQYTVSLNGKI